MGDLQRQVDRRGGNVLDLDVEGAEAAIKKVRTGQGGCG